tara:strand:+ start:871 stop:1158 length:288 start_codon:yes stop_codon:yes gene_type:complete
MVLEYKDPMDTITKTLESGEYDIAIYTKDNHLFIGVKRPHSQMQYYDNDEKANTTYHLLTQDFIDSLEIVCMITYNHAGLPAVVYGSVRSIPLLK